MQSTFKIKPIVTWERRLTNVEETGAFAPPWVIPPPQFTNAILVVEARVQDRQLAANGVTYRPIAESRSSTCITCVALIAVFTSFDLIFDFILCKGKYLFVLSYV